MIAKTLPLNIKITSSKGLLGHRTNNPIATFNGVKMGYIRERKLKDGGARYQAEIRLKGHPTLTAMFDRKTDAKNWIQKVEADIR